MILPFFNLSNACTYTHTPLRADANTLALKHGNLEGQVEVLINIHQIIMVVFPGICPQISLLCFRAKYFYY